MQKVQELVPGMLIWAAGRPKDMEEQSKEQLTLLAAWWDWSMGKEQKMCDVTKWLIAEYASFETPPSLQGLRVTCLGQCKQEYNQKQQDKRRI